MFVYIKSMFCNQFGRTNNWGSGQNLLLRLMSNCRIAPGEGTRYGNTTAPRDGPKIESAHIKFKTDKHSQKRRARRKK